MQNNNSLRRSLVFACLFQTSFAMADAVVQSPPWHAELDGVSIQFPPKPGLRAKTDPVYKEKIVFSGPMVVHGYVTLRWQNIQIDIDANGRPLTELQPVLLLVLDWLISEPLPHVSFSGEAYSITRTIELGRGQQSLDEALTAIWGRRRAQKIKADQSERSVAGRFELDTLSTYVHCDSRFHEATLKQVVLSPETSVPVLPV